MAYSDDILKLNFCEYDDLKSLPGIGTSIADYLWTFREAGVDINQKTLARAPYLRTFNQLLDLISHPQI